MIILVGLIAFVCGFICASYIKSRDIKINFINNKFKKIDKAIPRLIDEACKDFPQAKLTFPDFLNNIKEIVSYGLLEEGKLTSMDYADLYNHISEYISNDVTLVDKLNRVYNSINIKDEEMVDVVFNDTETLQKLVNVPAGVFDRDNDNITASPFTIGGFNNGKQ